MSEPAAALPAAWVPRRRHHTQARPALFPGLEEPPSSGGGRSFDQGLGSSLMTVLGCLGRLRSAVVYFHRVLD